MRVVKAEIQDDLTKDIVHISGEEWNIILNLIRGRITELEERPGHICGLRSMGEYDRLVALICKVDI